MSDTSNDTIQCVILVTQDLEILLFYLLPPPRNHSTTPRKEMLPKNKQKKYTLTLVNKTGYSRSALGVKHTDIECSHYSIFSLNMRIMAIGLNVIRDNSKKSSSNSSTDREKASCSNDSHLQ